MSVYYYLYGLDSITLPLMFSDFQRHKGESMCERFSCVNRLSNLLKHVLVVMVV